MTAAVFSEQFGCPGHIGAAMAVDAGPLLMAVKRIGPKRVQWASDSPGRSNYGSLNSLTMWCLDGRRATVAQILNAARIPLEDYVR